MCLVEELLKNRFSKRDFEGRKSIINQGRPMPDLPNLRSSNKKCVRYFQTNLYERKKWLTGNSHLNRLFCWPCVLFNLDKTVWNDKGYDDLNNLHMAMLKHERSQRHIRSMIDLKTFGNVCIDLQLDAVKRQRIQQHNEKVKQNRAIMRRLVDTVIFLGRHELPFGGHFESDASNNRGNYKELLYLISKYDEKLSVHLDTASSIFSGGHSSRIQNDLTDAIKTVMLNEIETELRQAKFVAILLDETSDISNYSQMSTVLRYVSKDCVKERFIGFNDVSGDRSAKALSEHVFKCVETWKCGHKLIAQTYDGAATMTGQLNRLQSKVRDKYESAMFIHCSAHVLNVVLSQACSAIKECKIFCSTINGLSTFFTKSPKRTAALDAIVKKRFPQAAATRWNYSSPLVNTTKENHDFLIGLFENILENPETWDGDTINSAIGFHHHLKDPDFLFLLEVFSDIFSFTDVLFNILQDKNIDIVHCKEQIDQTVTTLENKLQNFSMFYELSEEKYDPTRRTKRPMNTSLDPLHYKMLYNNIIGRIVDQLKVRYKSLEELKFIELLNFSKAKEYCKQFPVDALNSLKAIYGTFFDMIRLQSELNVVYSMEDLMQLNICNLMKYIYTNDLVDAMPELLKLCDLILTIPSTIASEERSFSTLERIKTYQRNTAEEQRIPGLALMSIEQDLLQHIMKSEDFYERVINIFALKDQRIELNYK